MIKTYQIEKLYHKFLKPRGISISCVELLALRLFEADFITLIQDENAKIERYYENEKLTSREHRDQLFKIVNSMKG